MWRGPKKRDFLSKLCTQEWIPGFPTLLLLVSQRGRENDSTTSISKFMSYLNLPVYYRTHWGKARQRGVIWPWQNFWICYSEETFFNKRQIAGALSFILKIVSCSRFWKGVGDTNFPQPSFLKGSKMKKTTVYKSFPDKIVSLASPNCIYNKF